MGVILVLLVEADKLPEQFLGVIIIYRQAKRSVLNQTAKLSRPFVIS